MYGSALTVGEPLAGAGTALLVAAGLLLFIAISLALTFGPIALMVAGILKALNSPGRVRFTMSPAAQQMVGQTVQALLGLATADQPLATQASAMVMVVDAARRQGGALLAFSTERFASQLASGVPLPRSTAAVSSVSLAPSGAPGRQMEVRVARADGATEYWRFVRAAQDSGPPTPATCPGCGAPTAGSQSGACRFCGASFPSPSATPALTTPAHWLLDEISLTPPALAA